MVFACVIVVCLVSIYLGKFVMGRIDLHEELRLRNFKWEGPRYYDYPDGEDLLGKLKFTTYWAGVAGLVVGGTYACGVPKLPPTFRGKLLRTVQGAVPCLGAAVLFTTTTYFSTVLRKKDDELNYVLGGLVAGASLAATTSVPFLGVIGAIVFPFIGAFKKYTLRKGEKLIPPVRTSIFPPYIMSRMNSMMAERRGNWTKD